MANAFKPKDTLTAAIELTQAGTRVVPVPFGQKGCFLKGWQNLRLGESDLATHFSGQSNLGILLGEPSGGLVDVDLDHELCKTFAGWLPPTDRVHGRSGNPSSHYWYVIEGAAPKTLQLKTPSGEMIIELRSTGGQTVIPPSVYVDSTGAEDHLHWERNGSPGVVTVDFLINSVKKIAAATILAENWPAIGSRHEASLALAGALLRHGWGADDAADFIERVASAAGDEEALQRRNNVLSTAGRLECGEAVKGIPSLKKIVGDEVVSLVGEWLSWDQFSESEREWEDPVLTRAPHLPDFPASLLPSPYREFASALAQSTEVPEALCILSILSIVSTASTKKFVVVPRPDWQESINIYVLVALPPANNKSQILNRCLKPIVFWEFREQRQIEPQRLKAISAKKNHEARIASFRLKLGKEQDPNKLSILKSDILNEEQQLNALVVPAVPKLFVNDVTPESLSAQLVEQGGRLGIISDEGGFFENIAGLYTGGKANNDVVLKGIDGGNVRIDRKDRSITICPYLTIAIVAQPQILKNMGERKALQGKGIQERFLYCIPPSKLGNRTLKGPPIPPAAESAYSAAVEQLLDIKLPVDDNGICHPKLLYLTPAAEAAWNQWRLEIEPMLGPDGELAPCLGWGGKLAGYTLRLAGLLELMEHGPKAHEVGRLAMDNAIIMAKLLIPHTLAAFGLMGQNPAQDLAERIIERLRRLGQSEVTRTKLLRMLGGGYQDVKRLNEALEILTAREIICLYDVTTTPGKRTTRIYRVNPALFHS